MNKTKIFLNLISIFVLSSWILWGLTFFYNNSKVYNSFLIISTITFFTSILYGVIYKNKKMLFIGIIYTIWFGLTLFQIYN